MNVDRLGEFKEKLKQINEPFNVQEEFFIGALLEIQAKESENRAVKDNIKIPEVNIPDFNFETGLDPSLNTEYFMKQLDDVLRDTFECFHLELRKENVVVSTKIKGPARFPIDTMPRAWFTSRRMHVASISKFITAIAIVEALQDRNLDPNTTQIGEFLPGYWSPGPSFDQITFGTLLNHTSGMEEPNIPFTQVREKVEFLGSITGSSSTSSYSNQAYILLRIILAIVTGGIERNKNVNIFSKLENDLFWDAKTISHYATYTNEKYFEPLGFNARISPSPVDALGYDNPQTLPGYETKSAFSFAGSVGWHLSADQLHLIANAFVNNELGVDKGYMIQNRFGFPPPNPVFREPVWKNPIFYVGGSWRNDDLAFERATLSNLWFLHHKYTLSFLGNSSSILDIDNAIYQTYLANI